MANIKMPTAKKVGNKYEIRFQYGRGLNGAYRYKRISAPTQKEIYRLYEDFMTNHGWANNSLIEKQSLYSYLKNWGELYYKATVKEQTYVGFLNALESRIKPFPIAGIQMPNINTDLLQRYVSIDLVEAQYSRDTICKTWRYIRNCLQNGIDKGEIKSIPLHLVKMPTEENVITKKKKVLPFSASDVEKIKIEAAKTYSNGKPKYFYGNIILLLINTGLRIGELLALTWGDIDFEENIMKINKSSKIYQDKSENALKKTKEVIGNTKTQKSNRIVVINKTAKEILLQIRESHPGHTGKKDRVILSSKFTVPHPRNVSRCLEAITKNACTDLQTSGVHRLRHTYATMFLNTGMPISFISNQLGHAKESTTRDIYISYLNDAFQKDKEIFEQF